MCNMKNINIDTKNWSDTNKIRYEIIVSFILTLKGFIFSLFETFVVIGSILVSVTLLTLIGLYILTYLHIIPFW
jgi:hypothetical protein